MTNVFKSAFLALSLTLGFAARAEEHPMSSIVGTGIDLKTRDHAFAGSIGDWLASGSFKHEGFVSKISLLRGEESVEAEFTQKDGVIGGTLAHTVDGHLYQTTLKFVKASKTAPQFLFELNGQPLEVSIVSDDFQNNHFINPTYSASINGRPYSFTLKGEACYGYSAHLIMMIYGALAHIQE
jgi:hypothetical protein